MTAVPWVFSFFFILFFFYLYYYIIFGAKLCVLIIHPWGRLDKLPRVLFLDPQQPKSHMSHGSHSWPRAPFHHGVWGGGGVFLVCAMRVKNTVMHLSLISLSLSRSLHTHTHSHTRGETDRCTHRHRSDWGRRGACSRDHVSQINPRSRTLSKSTPSPKKKTKTPNSNSFQVPNPQISDVIIPAGFYSTAQACQTLGMA